MNQLSYPAQPSCCNIVNCSICNAHMRNSLPAPGICELVPSPPALGRSGCFCVTSEDHVISSDAMQQRKSIWSLLHCSPQIYELGTWGEFQLLCWLSWESWWATGCLVLCIQKLWLWPRWSHCCSISLRHAGLRLSAFALSASSILCTSCSGQTLLHYAQESGLYRMQRIWFYTIIDNKQHHNIATNWFFLII